MRSRLCAREEGTSVAREEAGSQPTARTGLRGVPDVPRSTRGGDTEFGESGLTILFVRPPGWCCGAACAAATPDTAMGEQGFAMRPLACLAGAGIGTVLGDVFPRARASAGSRASPCEGKPSRQSSIGRSATDIVNLSPRSRRGTEEGLRGVSAAGDADGDADILGHLGLELADDLVCSSSGNTGPAN